MVEELKIRGGSFKTMALHPQLLRNIEFNNPTPIQRLTIPLVFEKRNIMGIARTGSGKTLCYLIPSIQRAVDGENVLILVPTKELALQVKRVEKKLSFRLPYKGRIIVSTLRDIEINDIDLLVVDEIDRVLEEPSLNEYFQKINEQFNCQKIFFSATLPNSPLDVKIVQVETKIPDSIKHFFYYVPSESKEAALLNILDRNKKTIIFVATKYSVDFIIAVLQKYGYRSRGIYSAMDTEARQISFDEFLTNKVRFLVVTDVAARGLDIPQLDVSISYDLSDEKTFVHRVGRIRGMGEQHSLVTYNDIYHFFNIKETHAPDVEIGSIPQALLDRFKMNDLNSLKFIAMRGHQRCLSFRSKVSVPSEFKSQIESFKIHSKFKQNETLADKLKELKKKDEKADIKGTKEPKSFKDQLFIPYTSFERKTHSSAFSVMKDDYVISNQKKVKYNPKPLKKLK